ncbi:BTAD domain-containing putative transcriptional regulator [Nocardia tengchongensis]|uniref:AfsR/SARP family transcriptional regulator n=1 Tax=Nocardia tengchongensis TaxID=2055889 RepID=UPI0036B65448
MDLHVGQQGLLALFAWRSPGLMAKKELLEEIWPEEVPKSGLNALQARVSRLRRAFTSCEPGQTRDRLRAHPGGYRLTLDDIDCDFLRFDRLRREASAVTGDPVRALRLLDTALALWRGPALHGAELGSAGRKVAATLDDVRLLTLAEAIGLRLSLGRHREVVPDLQDLVARHPYEEIFHDQLIVALYRCGRPQQALAVYGRLRRNLVEGFGMEPSPALQQRMREVLRNNDAALGASWDREGGVGATAAPPLSGAPRTPTVTPEPYDDPWSRHVTQPRSKHTEPCSEYRRVSNF